MKEILKQCSPEEVIAIYTNSDDTDSFCEGFVKAFNDEDFLIYHISPHGLYDGYIVKKTEHIYRINQKGMYEQKILNLYSFRNQEHNNINIVDNNIMFSVLEYARKNKLVVSIELFESGVNDIQGFVIENEDYICIDQCDDYSQEVGQTHIKLNDISELRCDTDDEIVLRLLQNKQNRKSEIMVK